MPKRKSLKIISKKEFAKQVNKLNIGYCTCFDMYCKGFFIPHKQYINDNEFYVSWKCDECGSLIEFTGDIVQYEQYIDRKWTRVDNVKIYKIYNVSIEYEENHIYSVYFSWYTNKNMIKKEHGRLFLRNIQVSYIY